MWIWICTHIFMYAHTTYTQRISIIFKVKPANVILCQHSCPSVTKYSTISTLFRDASLQNRMQKAPCLFSHVCVCMYVSTQQKCPESRQERSLPICFFKSLGFQVLYPVYTILSAIYHLHTYGFITPNVIIFFCGYPQQLSYMQNQETAGQNLINP